MTWWPGPAKALTLAPAMFWYCIQSTREYVHSPKEVKFMSPPTVEKVCPCMYVASWSLFPRQLQAVTACPSICNAAYEYGG